MLRFRFQLPSQLQEIGQSSCQNSKQILLTWIFQVFNFTYEALHLSFFKSNFLLKESLRKVENYEVNRRDWENFSIRDTYKRFGERLEEQKRGTQKFFRARAQSLHFLKTARHQTSCFSLFLTKKFQFFRKIAPKSVESVMRCWRTHQTKAYDLCFQKQIALWTIASVLSP